MASYTDLLSSYDPVARIKEGEAYADRLFDTGVRRQAGALYAQGDRRGAAGTMARAGNIEGAAQIEGYGRSDAKEGREAEAERRKELTDFSVRGWNAILLVPEAERNNAFEAALAPAYRAAGIPEEVIDQLRAAPKDDASIQQSLAALGQSPELQLFNTGGAIIGADKRTGQERSRIVAPIDPLEQEYMRAKIRATEAQVGQREASAEKARRPPAPRGGGGRRDSRGPGLSYGADEVTWGGR